MKLRRLFARIAVALVLVSMVSILPHQVRAQPTSDLVWVATDLTPQALAHCTLNGTPCPTGSIRVVNFTSASHEQFRLQPDHDNASSLYTRVV